MHFSRHRCLLGATLPLYDWQQVVYTEWFPGDSSTIQDQLIVFSNGTYQDYTYVEEGVYALETGIISKQELRRLDAQVDQINRDPIDTTQYIDTEGDLNAGLFTSDGEKGGP